MSDIMDEFEFKPLTEGLGFHKKSSGGTLQNTNMDKAGFEVSPSVLSTPLPRTEKSLPEIPSTTVDEILKTLNQKKRPHFDSPAVGNKIDATPMKPLFKTTAWDFSAFLLDLMLVLAINLLCLIVTIITTKVDLFANLYSPDAGHMIYASLGLLLAGTAWMYMVATRLFMGCTPGEWILDLRLGLPEETGSAMYSMLVAVRATLILASGIVLFPVLSAITNKDLLGRWMGLELMKKA